MVSVPAPKISGVVWTPIRITPKIVIVLMCEYPGCQRLFMRGFRFQSVLKGDPREKLRRSWLRPSADKTKLPVAHEKQSLVPRVMCEWKPHSEKEKNKEKNLAKTREITFSTKPQPSKSATPKPCVVLWGNNGYFFRFLLRHQLEALVQFITGRISSLPRSHIF